MKTANEAAAWLAAHDNYLIFTHRRPDGDAFGSAAALCMGLRQIGKDAWVFPNGERPEFLTDLVAPFFSDGDLTGKTLIYVDMSGYGVLAYNAEHAGGKFVFGIDHHASNVGFARENYIRPEAAACAEIIYDVLLSLGVELTKPIAEALYVGLSTDTGCFRFSNTTAKTLAVASACLQTGIETFPWNRKLFIEKSIGRLKMESYIIENLRSYAGGAVQYCFFPPEKEKEWKLTAIDTDNIASIPMTVKGTKLSVVVSVVSDGVKIGMRANEPYDCGKYCTELGGGGHRAAAGATIPGTVEEVEKKIFAVLRKNGVEV